MKPQVILVLASWSSGSSAISGFLHANGAYMFPPFITTTDPKSPETYESEMFRAILLETIQEETLEFKMKTDLLKGRLTTWFHEETVKARSQGTDIFALKHPLSALILRELCELVDPIFVVVTRPLARIEETRVRRNWHSIHGRAGAEVIYKNIYSFLQENNKSYIAISFEDYLNSEKQRRMLLEYCGIDVSAEEAQRNFEKSVNKRD